MLCASVAIMIGLVSNFVFSDQELGVHEGHKLLQESFSNPDVNVGAKIGPLWFHDTTGKSHYLDEITANGPAVFVFLSTKCPLAKRYTVRLNGLCEAESRKSASVFGVFSNADETNESISDYVAETQYPFPVVRDVNGYLARRFAASMTPQAFLVDSAGRLRFRGAIDDNRVEDRVKENYLRDALAAVLESKDVACEQTKTLGCTIHLPETPTDGSVTYSTHVARILQDNCVTCHRDGQVAPFSLTSYDEAKTWATEIKEYTHARQMPPWKPEPGFGEFQDVRRLSEDELTLIAKWVDHGTPEGDSSDLPPTAKFNDDWALGEPDLIVEMPEEYKVGPEGDDDYRHFIIPIKLEKDQFVESIDVQPGNRETVHHVIVYADTSGKARELDAADPGPGYSRFGDVGFPPAAMLGGWAPGQAHMTLPEGTGRWLPKDCDIVMQVHYYRTGVWETDRTRVGLYFSKAEKPIVAHYGVSINTKFKIPPGEINYRVEGSLQRKKLKEPVYVVSVYPHMHLLGKDIKVTATLPDGKELPFIWIKNWDFNWQSPYHFKQLQYLPAGSEIKVVSHFDNSASNPHNPHDPPKQVGWGEKTTDEMCLSFFTFLKASDYNPDQRQLQVAERDSTVR
jgi:mono/diheme cytochrome c family protein